ncbi:MAG: hypothetical protein ACFFDN_03880 [Candidatus Hodarchaeota archaeon]
MNINEKRKIFKWFGFGIIIFVFIVALLFLLGFNVLSFPFPPSLPPAGAIIDFSPVYNLAFWYLFLRLMVFIGEKVILHTDNLLEPEKPKEEKKA